MAETLLSRVSVDGGRAIPDAATGEIIGHAPEHTVADLERAIEAAQAAQPAWAAKTSKERGEILHAAATKIQEYAEELATIVSREQGKPLSGPGARLEVGGVQGWLHTNADLEIEPQVLIDDAENYSELIYKPVGLVGAIGPWNWPMMITIWQIAPSLKMGNAVIVKPSEYTPLSVLTLIEVLNEVLPAGVLQVVSGGRVGALHGLVDESEVGAALPLLEGGGGVDAEGLDLLGDMEHGAWLDAEGSGVRPHLA